MAAIVDNMLGFVRKTDDMVIIHQLEELLDQILELAATDYYRKRCQNS
ncbi:MAG: hypothetical protein GY702_22565 [Desulfobulbaceae bacterium]|nr:hypothetical protein [Desulfobulbaceae bacterium]